MTMPPTCRFDFGPLASAYDRWYETAEGRRHDVAQQEIVQALLPSPAGGNGRLLDVGCGTGHWSRFFVQLGYEVTGIDVASEMVEVARARQLSSCRFYIADAMDLPFPSRSFDVVCAMAVLEFVADVPQVCTEMVRCLNPGGCLVIGTLNRLAEINRERIASHAAPYESAQMFAPEELRHLLKPFGEVRLCLSKEPGTNDNDQPGAFIVARVTTPAGYSQPLA
jgi:ubiquinone/menaquinone biosynthesis C-methylase UbiE